MTPDGSTVHEPPPQLGQPRPHVVERRARPGDYDEVRQIQHLGIMAPRCNFRKRISPRDEEELRCRLERSQLRQRVERVRPPAAHQLEIRRGPAGSVGHSQLRHLPSMIPGRARAVRPVRRLRGWDDQHLVEVESRRRGAAGGQMPLVEGIERASEHPDPGHAHARAVPSSVSAPVAARWCSRASAIGAHSASSSGGSPSPDTAEILKKGSES